MKVKRLVIENFKSIERIELIEPNPFTVFVGPNGSGKSNIFEALEFIQLRLKIRQDTVLSLFGGIEGIAPKQSPSNPFNYVCEFEAPIKISNNAGSMDHTVIATGSDDGTFNSTYHEFSNYCHLFIDSKKTVRFPVSDNQRLSLSAANLEKVLKRILVNDISRDEIFEWLELFTPGFKSVEVDDRNELHWFEKFTPGYFTKDLISDGTYNILALLTAIYQSDEPQFLCIEELENGLNPEVVKELVQFLRYKCEEKGHYIWLNTHSQTLVSQLTSDEIVVVDKVKGFTQIKQFKGRDFHGLRMDEAWLMNVLGGGLPF